MMKYRVTICVPIFNGSKDLDMLEESLVENLKYRNDIEVIFSDNGSTDDTRNKLQKIKNKLENILILEQEKNIGFSANFIKCFKYANGEYITFIGHDDKLKSVDVLISMIQWMEANSVYLASSNIEVFRSENIHNKRIIKFSSKNYINRDSRRIVRDWLSSALASIGGWVVKNEKQVVEGIPKDTLYPEYYLGYNALKDNNIYGAYSEVFYSQSISDNNNQLANKQYTDIEYFTDFADLTIKFIDKNKEFNAILNLTKIFISNCHALKAFGCKNSDLILFQKKYNLFPKSKLSRLYFIIILILPSILILKLLIIYRNINKK